MISSTDVVVSKYGWVNTAQSILRSSTMEWKAGFLSWCETPPDWKAAEKWSQFKQSCCKHFCHKILQNSFSNIYFFSFLPLKDLYKALSTIGLKQKWFGFSRCTRRTQWCHIYHKDVNTRALLTTSEHCHDVQKAAASTRSSAAADTNRRKCSSSNQAVILKIKIINLIHFLRLDLYKRY